MQTQQWFRRKMFRHYRIIFFLLSVMGAFMTGVVNAQVTLKIDAQTRAVVFAGTWKAGEFLSIHVNNVATASFDSLAITYRADEYMNTKGITAFGESKANILDFNESPSFDLLPIMIQAKDDAYVTISLYQGSSKVDEQVYKFRVSGSMKFDVSMGAFFTGLRNEAYVLQPLSDSTNQIIKERNGKVRVGTGILAHLHSRYNSWLNWGISGGFELNSDARIGYLAGFSIFVGYDRKFVITGGAVASKKSVLSAVYAPNDIISREITTAPMVEVWAGALFTGLSYNF